MFFPTRYCYRNVEKDLQNVDTSNSLVQALHQQVSDIVKVRV